MGLHYTMIVYAVTVLFEHIAYTLMLPTFGGLVASLVRVADAEIARVKAVPLGPDHVDRHVPHLPGGASAATSTGPDLIGRSPGKRTKLATAHLLSILVPAYNEEEYIEAAIQRAMDAPLPDGLTSEIVAVDDGSTDATAEILDDLACRHPGRVRVFRPCRQRRERRGHTYRAATRGGRVRHHSGWRPRIRPLGVLPRCCDPLLSNKADVVYGSRFLISGERRVIYYWHSLANHLLTTACNIAADLNLTDMETCYKAFRTTLARSIPLRSNRFGIEPELTIKFAKRQASIYEVPISYYGRTYEEGKKIGALDAVSALWVILRCWLTRDIYADRGARILDSLAGTRRFNAWMADTVRPYLGKHVLELGSGIGNMTRHLSRGRKTYVASDIDEEHMSRLRVRFRGRPNLRIRKCDLCDSARFRSAARRFR